MSKVLFPNHEGIYFEGDYHHSNRNLPSIALLLNSHPSKKTGNMHNPVITTLAKTLTKLGFSVLRFNSRALSASQSATDDDVDMLVDAAHALNILYEANKPCSSVWVIGYDHGAYLGMQLLMRRPEITNWICIAPPLINYKFNFLSPCPRCGLIISSDNYSKHVQDCEEQFVADLNAQEEGYVKRKTIHSKLDDFKDNLPDLARCTAQYVLDITHNQKLRA